MRVLVVLVLLVLGATEADAKRIQCAQPGDAWIDSPLPDDAVRVRIRYSMASGGTDELWTVPQQRYLCFRTPPVTRGFVEVVTVDAQGRETKVPGASIVFGEPHRHPRHFCGMGGFGLLLLFPVVAILLAVGLFVRSAVRRRKLRLPPRPRGAPR